MRSKLNFQAFSNGNRHEVISDLKEMINSNNGCILNFNMYSDIALSLAVEMEENRLSRFYDEMNQLVSIDESAPENISSNSEKEWLIFINLSFGKASGKLKSEIPNVPG